LSAAPPPLGEALDGLLRFGTMMLRAGDTVFRVRESMGLLATNMGLDSLALHVTIDGMTATVRRGPEAVTTAIEIAPLGINASRISALERLARDSRPGLTAAELAASLDAIDKAPPFNSILVVAIAIGFASGAFCYLNSGDLLGIAAAIAAGSLGQLARSLMFGRRLNQYAVTALCAILASGFYCLLVVSLAGADFGPSHAVGLISSVLFLVPGFPLVASLLDLLQHQTVAGLARLAYGIMVLLAAAFGLSAVVAIAGLTAISSEPMAQDVDVLTLLLRAVASFAGGCGFAILYNSSPRTVLVVGCLALLGNELRLWLHDLGMQLPPATFLGALVVGLLASLVRSGMGVPRIVLTVPSIIIMTPGIYAFHTVVFFNQGDVLSAIEAGATCGFIVGAMALGLAAARFISDRKWIVER
jgi:uncharacterized membrane protein YjjP (DUF1212 family)